MVTEEQKTQLVEAAKAARQNVYPKNAAYVYSAAVLTDTGAIYSASNYHSDTHSLTLHGEQTALSHAAAHGEGTIQAIAVTSNEALKAGEFTPPCHMCKQLLWESSLRSGSPMLIILSNNNGEIKELMLDEVMQLPWPPRK
jgi:cytidine deaminase